MGAKQGLEAGNGSQSLELGLNMDWRLAMMPTSRKRVGFLDPCRILMGTSKKGGLFLEVGSDVDGDLRHLCRVSVGGGHKASRASLQAELARLGLSGRPWVRPDTVTEKRKLEERSEREVKERTARYLLWSGLGRHFNVCLLQKIGNAYLPALECHIEQIKWAGRISVNEEFSMSSRELCKNIGDSLSSSL